MKTKITILLTVLASIFALGMKTLSYSPNAVYRVYLNGKSLGLIKSKTSLEKYIDKMQTELKNKYKVNKVYAPEGLKIEKELTYNNNIMSTKKIYEKIQKESDFTLDGYKITIKPYNS